MRAVVFADGGRVEVTDVTAPVIERPTDAIVRVTRAAICGTDLHFLHGKAPIEPGAVLGHEAVGVVESIGAEVHGVRPGERVVVSFHIACGSCWFCRRGETALCEEHAILGAGPFGGDLPGAQAERVRVPFADTNLLAIPDEVDDERALFVGDVLTTGLYGASLASVTPEETAAVVGLGPVGYCTVQALFALGARTVFGIDVDPARRALAEAAGAIPVDAARVNPQMVLARATQDRGADVVIEAVGSSPAYETSVDVVRRGGRVVVVGMYAGEVTELQLGVYWARALSVRFAGLCPTHAYWQRTMALLAAGRLDPSPIVSHRLSLEEAAEGYELFDRRLATKVLLAPVDPGPGSVAEPSGITELIDGLVRQNLRRDPTRRLLPGDVITIEAVDAGVAVSIRRSPGGIAVVDGRDPGACVVVSAASTTLLELAGAPLRFGLPDAFTHEGRALIADLLTKRIRVRGLIRHLGTVRRLTMLLSAR